MECFGILGRWVSGNSHKHPHHLMALLRKPKWRSKYSERLTYYSLQFFSGNFSSILTGKVPPSCIDFLIMKSISEFSSSKRRRHHSQIREKYWPRKDMSPSSLATISSSLSRKNPSQNQPHLLEFCTCVCMYAHTYTLKHTPCTHAHTRTHIHTQAHTFLSLKSLSTLTTGAQLRHEAWGFWNLTPTCVNFIDWWRTPDRSYNLLLCFLF